MSIVMKLKKFGQNRFGKPATNPTVWEEPSGYWGLTFTALQAGSKVKMEKFGSSAPVVSLEYSTDDGATWNTYTVSTSSSYITLANIGDRVCFRAGGTNGINHTFSHGLAAENHFVLTGRIYASGDISSIINRNESVTTLTDAHNVNVFSYLFRDCESLVRAPKLPATSLSIGCYEGMFLRCTNLVVAPKLPALATSQSCYVSMFKGCTSLTVAPELPANTIAMFCYQGMFEGCTSLVKAPRLLSTSTARNCYAAMFRGCTSLTDAPELYATDIATSSAYTTAGCYAYMFKNCSSLRKIYVSFSEFGAYEGPAYGSPTDNWVEGVADSGTFICPSELSHTSEDFGISKIPVGWTVQTY